MPTKINFEYHKYWGSYWAINMLRPF